MINNLTVDGIVDHGTTIDIIAHDTKTGVVRLVRGESQAMSAAIEGLGIAPGVEVGVFINDDGVDCLCEPDVDAAVTT